MTPGGRGAGGDRRGRLPPAVPAPVQPDLNPIENAFSKLKRLLWAAAERTVDGLWATVGRSLDRFTRPECRNYFRHCGYTKPAKRSGRAR